MSKILVDKCVLKQALEAMQAALSDDEPYIERCKQTITALRDALAEQVPCNKSCAPGYCYCEPVQEPVAWIHTDPDKPRVKFLEWRDDEPGYRGRWIKTPLYTAPPQRKPLTEEQKLDLVTNWFSEEWAIKNALGLLDDYDTVQAHEIGE